MDAAAVYREKLDRLEAVINGKEPDRVPVTAMCSLFHTHYAGYTATEGIFGETASGVTLGVLRRLLADGVLDPGAETVIINSGDGLKTLDAVAAPAGAAIRPTLEAFESWESS